MNRTTISRTKRSGKSSLRVTSRNAKPEAAPAEPETYTINAKKLRAARGAARNASSINCAYGYILDLVNLVPADRTGEAEQLAMRAMWWIRAAENQASHAFEALTADFRDEEIARLLAKAKADAKGAV